MDALSGESFRSSAFTHTRQLARSRPLLTHARSLRLRRVAGRRRGSVADMAAGADAGGAEPDSSGQFLRCFGRQMKLLREVAGLTQAQLGEQVGYGEGRIAAVEQGRGLLAAMRRRWRRLGIRRSSGGTCRWRLRQRNCTPASTTWSRGSCRRRSTPGPCSRCGIPCWGRKQSSVACPHPWNGRSCSRAALPRY